MSLGKRRGFIFANSEIYGGIASTWDYGPLGCRTEEQRQARAGGMLWFTTATTWKGSMRRSS